MLSRQKGQVVVQQETIWGSAHGHIEFARQVAGASGAQQPHLNRLHQGAGVDDLLRVNARQRVAGDVARVVVARLAAGQTPNLQGLQKGRHVLQQQASQLEILAGGDVGTALIATTIDHLSQQLQLLSTDNAVG